MWVLRVVVEECPWQILQQKISLACQQVLEVEAYQLWTMWVQRLLVEERPRKITVDLQVVHRQGVVAVPALQHRAEVQVRVLHQQTLEVGVLPCQEVAGVLPQQQQLAAAVHLAVVVYLQPVVVVQASEVGVGVVLQVVVVVVAAVFHQQVAVVRAAHHGVEVRVHLLFMAQTKPVLHKLWLGMISLIYAPFVYGMSYSLSSVGLCLCMLLLFFLRQGSSLLWTHMLRPMTAL